ncbi:aspartate aminotransferase [Colletotrichum sojae]|uniref:Aspartate aminotransferase n=1 Tax=Colletotrichum sojae TaxID=2175907 RepID=A0A8H6IUP3_9PEZI|nr:aspartate aminotransferase [Colletotrichum sojae]
MFGHIQPGPPDPMFTLKKNADTDLDFRKVDLGVGIYRSEAGVYQELEVVKQYELTTGDPEFLELAAEVMFGNDSDALKPGRDAGPQITIYPYLDLSKHAVNFPALLDTVRTAPRGSVFVLQGCCYNPTGVDLNIQQWQELAVEMKAHGHLPIFDTAYQGLGDGFDEDAAGVRTFVKAGIELLVCQSFSKNFALYGERCGTLHVVAETSEVAANVKDRLRSLIRRTYSSSPAYANWMTRATELDEMRRRLKRNRQALFDQLTNVLKVRGQRNLKRLC